MKNLTFLVVFVFFLAACSGGDGGGGGGESKKASPNVFNPWQGVQESLPEDDLADGHRVLEFSDGMGISYDGRDAAGAEEVCRRETGDDGNIYEVCMNLEDDPYFVALENNAFVWHPLMFERFATSLDCYIYESDGSRGDKSDCHFEVFPEMGGEDFLCEAGLVNGDKALKCSDDWAVVVNGSEDESKSICRVHIESGAGRCLNSPKEGVEDAELILNMQRTVWDGYRSMQDNPEQFAPGNLAQALIPQDLPGGAKFTYMSEDESICTVDNDDSDGGMGEVMIAEGLTPPKICKIHLKVEADGFADRLLFVELLVLKDSDAQWGDYVRSNNYFYPGEVLDAQPVTSTDPLAVEEMYASLDEEICTVNESTGTVTALEVGECVIRMTARADYYLDVIIDRIIPVDAPAEVFQDIVWDAWAALDAEAESDPAVVGAVIPALAVPIAKVADGDADGELDDFGGSPVFEYEAEGDCSISSGREISFTNATECVVTVTVSAGARGQADYSKDFMFTPGLGSFELTWGGYDSGGNSTAFGADTAAFTVDEPATVPNSLTGVEYSYAASGGGCEVDEATGVLTIVGADGADEDGDPATPTNPHCKVTLTAMKDGYSEKMAEQMVEIAKKAQDPLTVPDNPYGVGGAEIFLAAGDSVNIVNAPTGGIGTLEYGRPDADAGICEVQPNGTVAILAGAAKDDDCLVQARWAGDENNEASDLVTLVTVTVRDAAEADLTWDVANTYGGASATLKVGADALAIGTAPSATDAGSPEYRSASMDTCTVAADGAVTAVGVGDCFIQFRYLGGSASNDKAASTWSESREAIAITKGDHPGFSGADFYGATPTVATGGTLALVNAPEGEGTAAYTLKDGSEDYCSVEEGTGVVTGIAAGSCTIQVAFDGGANYEALAAADLQAITVLELDQNIVTDNPYGAEPSMLVGEELALVNAPTATITDLGGNEMDGGAITYEEADANICTVDTEGTVTAMGEGSCVINIQVVAVDAVAADENADPVVVGNAAHNAATKEIATIAVGKGRLDFAWNPYRENTEYRAGTDALIGEVDVEGSGADVAYEVATAGNPDCSFGSGSPAAEKTLSTTNYGICVLRATVTLAEYEDLVLERSIRLRPGKITVTINDFNSSDKIKVGSTMAKKPVAYGSSTDGAVGSWRLLRGEKDCVLVNSADGSVIARAVSFADGTPECSIQLVVSKEGFETFRSDPVSIPLEEGDLGTITPPVYGTGTGNSLPLKILMGEVDDGEGSTMEGRTGQEGHLDMSMPPREGNHLPIHISAIEVEGYESNGTTAKADVCTIDDDNTSETFGRVSVSDAAENGDKCKVLTKVVAVGYGEESTDDVMLTVVSGELEFGTELNPVPVFAFMGDLKVGAQSHPSTKPSEDDSAIDDTYEGVSYLDLKDLPENYVTGMDEQTPPQPVEVAITWHYQVRATDAGGAALEMGCIITPDQNDSDRRVLVAYAAKVGGHCLVKAIAQVAGYAEQEVVISIPFAAGDLLFAEESPNKTLYAGNLRVGSPVAPGHAGHHYDDSRVAVDWGSFRVEGYDGSASDRSNDDSADDTAKDGVCSVDADGMVMVRDAAASGDICEVYAMASASNYNDSEEFMVGSLTVSDQLMFGALSGPVYNQGLALRGLPISVTTAPMVNGGENGADADVTWTYVATGYPSGTDRTDNNEDEPKEDVCSIDENNGTLTPGNMIVQGDFCEVVATVHASGYESKAAPVVTVTVNDTFMALTWGAFPSSGTVGMDIALTSNLPSSSPVADSFSYSTNANCNIVATPGSEKLVFYDNKECVVTATAEKENYLGFLKSFRVTPGPGTMTASFGYYGNVKVGTETPAPSTMVSVPSASRLTEANASIERSYEVVNGAGCSLNGNGQGRVTGTTRGATCQIKEIVSIKGYTDKEHTHNMNIIRGVQVNLAWANAYGNSPTLVANGSDLAIDGNSSPSSTPHGTTPDIQYGHSGTSGCTVNTSGTVSPGTTTGSCSVMARYKQTDNYEASNLWTEILNITVDQGTQTLTWNNPYGSSPQVVVGSTLDTSGSPTDTVVSDWGDVTYTSKTSSICSVNPSGRVTPEASGITGTSHTCTIGITRAANTHYNVSNEITVDITVTKGAITLTGADNDAKWGTYSDATVRADTTAPGINVSAPSAVTKTYAPHSSSTGCDVNTGNGTITGTTAGTDNCRVSVTLSATGYNSVSYDYDAVDVAKATQSLTWANPYGAGSPSVKVGETFDPVSQGKPSGQVHTTAPVSGVLTFASADTSNCDVHATSGRITPKPAYTGNCVINIKYPGNANFVESGTITDTVVINDGDITLTGADNDAKWGTYSDATVRADTTAPDINVSAPSAVTKTYAPHSSSTGCDVNTGNGTITGTAAGTDNCRVSVTLSATGYNSVSYDYDAVDVAKATQSLTWTNPYGAGSPSVKVGETFDPVSQGKPSGQVHTTAPVSGVLTFASADTSNCDVHATSGRITPKPAYTGNCVINIKYPGNANFVESGTITDTVVINNGDITVNGDDDATRWGAYGSISVGAETSAPSINTTSPVTVNKAYTSSDDTKCTVVEGTGAVTGVVTGTDNCEITLTLSKTGYDDLSYAYTMSVSSGSQSITWGQSDQSTTFNEVTPEFELTGYTTSTGEDVTYEIVAPNTAGCSWKGNSGTEKYTLEYTDKGSCDVRILVERTGYEDARTTPVTITIDPIDWTSVTWTGYSNGNAGTYGSAAPSRDAPQSTPSAGVTWSYSSDSNTVCTIDTGTGAMTHILLAGDCVVTAIPSKAGYADHDGIERTVTISEGTQPAPGAWGGTLYGGTNLAVGGGTRARGGTVPSNSKTDGGALVYTTESDACTVTDSSNGEIQGVQSGPCVVKGHFAAVTNKWNVSDKTTVATVTIEAGDQGDLGTWSESDINANFNTTPQVAEFTNVNGGTASYEVVPDDANSAECSFTDRTLSFANDGSCNIQVRVMKDGYNDWTSASVAVTVNPIPLTGVNWNNFTFNISFDSRKNLESVRPNGTRASDSLSYTSNTSSTCQFELHSHLRGLRVGTDNCTVEVSIQRKGYNDKTLSKTLSVLKGSQFDIRSWNNPYGQNPALASDGHSTLTVRNRPTPNARGGATTEYQLKGSITACTVAPNGTVTATTTTGTCAVEVRYAENNNYKAGSNWYTILNIQVTQAADWTTAPAWTGYNSGGNEFTVGDSVQTPDTPSSTPEADRWIYSTTSPGTICTVASNGDLTIVGAGDCVVTAVAQKTGYTAHSGVTHTVGILEALDVTWADYSPSNPTWASTVPTVTAGAVTVNDSGGSSVTASAYSLSYEVVAAETTNNSCSLASGTSPALTLNGAGTCVVQVTATDNDDTDGINYSSGTDKVTVTVVQGVLDMDGSSVVPFYLKGLPDEHLIDKTANITEYLAQKPSGGYRDNAGVVVTPTFSAVGTASSGGSSKANVCTVDASGTVTIGSAGSNDNICTISVTYAAANYASVTVVLEEFRLRPPRFSGPDSVGSGHYSGGVTVGNHADVNSNDLPSGGSGRSTESDPQYRTTAAANICTVNSSNGRVTGVGAGPCPVQVRWVDGDVGDSRDNPPGSWVILDTVQIQAGN